MFLGRSKNDITPLDFHQSYALRFYIILGFSATEEFEKLHQVYEDSRGSKFLDALRHFQKETQLKTLRINETFKTLRIYEICVKFVLKNLCEIKYR